MSLPVRDVFAAVVQEVEGPRLQEAATVHAGYWDSAAGRT